MRLSKSFTELYANETDRRNTNCKLACIMSGNQREAEVSSDQCYDEDLSQILNDLCKYFQQKVYYIFME